MNVDFFYSLTKLCAKTSMAIVIATAILPSFASAQEYDHYKLKVTCSNAATPDGIPLHAENAIVEVELDLAARDKPIKFCLPAFGQRFGERFSGLEFWNGGQKTSAVMLDARACSQSYEGEELTQIRYRLEMVPLNEDQFWAATSLSASATNGSLAIAGESLFVEIVDADESSKPVGTRVSIESRCDVFSSLGAYQGSKDSGLRGDSHLWAADSFSLIRSYWAFGDYRMLTAKAENLSLTLLEDTDWPVDVGIVGREAMAIIDQYAEIFGNKLPPKVAVFLFTSAFDLQLSDGFARPGGVVLQMGSKAARDPLRRRILLAHELFHLINGEGLRYGLEDFEKTAWFREGVTQYMAAKALQRAGLLSRFGFLDMLAKSSAKLLEPRKEVPAPVCYSSECLEVRDGWAYHLGFVLAYAIEQQWRMYQTQFTLEGFWKDLYARWSTEVRLGQAELKAGLERYSGFDFTAFFDQYVYGESVPPVEAILARDGLCLRRSSVPRYDIGMRYVLNPTLAHIIVRQVQDGMPAALAGLHVGDIIVPSPNTDWSDASDKRLTRIRDTARRTLKLPAQAGEAINVWMDECDQKTRLSP